MSMTSQGLRLRREPSKAGSFASLRSNTGGRFVLLLQAAGIQVPKGISMSAMALIRDMAAAGGTMAAAKSSCHARAGEVCQPAKAMGIIIKHGYARFVPAMKHYELTAEGRELLASAEEKGVMRSLAELEAMLRACAQAEEAGTLKREQRTQKGHDA